MVPVSFKRMIKAQLLQWVEANPRRINDRDSFVVPREK